MKGLKILRNILIGIFLVIFFSFTVAMAVVLLSGNAYGVPQFGNVAYITLNDEITSSVYKKGDIVAVKEAEMDDINVGDELFAYKVDKNKRARVDVGIVGEKYPDQNAVAFENGSTYAEQFIAGKADKVYKGLGTYTSIILSQWGFLFIVLVPNFLIFVYILAALISEIRYSKRQEREGV